MSVSYTTAAKVRGLVCGNTSGLAYIADSIIESFINRAEDEIDYVTRRAWRERTSTFEITQLGNEWRYNVLEGRQVKLPYRFIRPLRAGIAGACTSGSTTTSIIDTVNLTQADDYWNNWYLTFTSGPNEGQTRKVTDFANTSKTATVDAFPYTPAIGNTFFIGDGIEVWSGGSYLNWVISKTNGRNGDFWLDTQAGTLYFRTNPWLTGRHSVRVTYRYGESVVPGDIEQACTMMAACDVIRQEGLRALNPGGEGLQVMNPNQLVTSWTEQAQRLVDRKREVAQIIP